MKAKFIISSLLLANLSFAQLAGEFDTGFGNYGKVTLTNPAHGQVVQDMIVQPDGKIIAAIQQQKTNADFQIMRFMPNGLIDTTFGANGVTSVDFNGYKDVPYSLALQSDGKIIVGGKAGNGQITEISGFGILRLNTNGSVDTTFGTNGKVSFNFESQSGSYDAINNIAIQADGKIVVSGTAIYESSFKFAIARIYPDGTLDNNFSNDGKQTSNFSNSTSECSALKILPDGKFLLGGYSGASAAVLRLLPDGSFDNSYNGTGAKVVAANIYYPHPKMAFLNDNSIIFAGTLNNDVKVMKFDSNLEQVTSFGASGSVVVDIDNGSYDERVTKIITDNNGRIYTIGKTSTGGNSYFYILNFTANGTLNTNFSYDGKQLVSFDNINTAYSAVMQSDAKLIVGGASSPANQVTATGVMARLHVEAQGLGINDIKKLESVEVYPNPTLSLLNLKNIDKSLMNDKIIMTDLSGRIVHEKLINNINETLNVSHLNAGIYLLKIGSGAVVKIIKK